MLRMSFIPILVYLSMCSGHSLKELAPLDFYQQHATMYKHEAKRVWGGGE